jgi:hypothetical protein
LESVDLESHPFEFGSVEDYEEGMEEENENEEEEGGDDNDDDENVNHKTDGDSSDENVNHKTDGDSSDENSSVDVNENHHTDLSDNSNSGDNSNEEEDNDASSDTTDNNRMNYDDNNDVEVVQLNKEPSSDKLSDMKKDNHSDIRGTDVDTSISQTIKMMTSNEVSSYALFKVYIM